MRQSYSARSLHTDQSTARQKARRLWIFFFVVLTLILIPLALLYFTLRPLSPHRVSSAGNVLRVLFIGNSYTYVNNLPGLVMELSARESKPLDTEMVVEGGATLANHWAEGKALAAIQRGSWDYVVLQEQSTLGSNLVDLNGVDLIGDPASFQYYVRQFNAEIQKVGAKTVLFLTWARQNAPQNQKLLTQSYMDIANELHITLAPVGLAWKRALTNAPPFTLHQEDGSHPNAAGSYLAACAFYATFYQKSPEGLPASISSSLVDNSGVLQQGTVNLNPADARLLQQIAAQTVLAQQ